MFFSFRSLIEKYVHREEIINFFLAILELSKQHAIQLFQEEIESDIVIKSF